MSKAKGHPAPVAEIKEPEHVVETELNGNGEFNLPDGSFYSGDFKEVNHIKFRHGYGILTSGPEKYSGNWEKDLMHGYGEYYFGSGASYKGNFKNNLFDGEGTYSFADGSSYVGSWQQNKMHGNGVYIDSEKIKFEGNFFNGLYDSGRSYISLRSTNVVK